MGYYSRAFPDSQASAAAVPDWLLSRGEEALQSVRGGFVSYRALRYGYDPPCGHSPELLTGVGISCGCLTLPDVFETDYAMRIGRDGSLFLYRWLPHRSRGVFELYPGLFR